MTDITNGQALQHGNAPVLQSPPEIVPISVPAMPPGAPHAPPSRHPAIAADWPTGVATIPTATVDQAGGPVRRG